MRIITYNCSECGTIVAANEIEANRVMKCPGLECESVLKFIDLPEDDRQYFLDNADRYKL